MHALAEDPSALIQMGAPRLIHDDRELARYTASLFQLTAKPSPTEAEEETISLLTLLIETYEAQYRLPASDPITLLRYLMEQGNLLQRDLEPELGSRSNVSMILSGQRKLSLKNAFALAERFRLRVDAFLPESMPTEGLRGVADKRAPVRRRARRSAASG